MVYRVLLILTAFGLTTSPTFAEGIPLENITKEIKWVCIEELQKMPENAEWDKIEVVAASETETGFRITVTVDENLWDCSVTTGGQVESLTLEPEEG